jgi:hypothetical protein
MEHLTMLDASFVQAEDSDTHVSLAVGAVSIISGPPPDYGDLVSAFADRARAIPRCTHVLSVYPFDLGAPEWVDEPNFDIAMLSYADRFFFGITADFDSAPDVDALARGIEDGVRNLATLGGSRVPTQADGEHR